MNEHFPYLHGFSETEQQRLRKQAAFAEHTVYSDISLGEGREMLEVGSGVGAQSEILLRRFPKINLTCVDLNPKQLEAAQKNLEALPWAKGRWNLNQMSADDLSFNSAQFDGAFICWLLEHVPNPSKVLSEVRRVLRPGSKVTVTEVMNSSFFLDPYSPHVWKYWMAFNDFQHDQAGDPFIGAKLGNLLTAGGFKDVHTKVKTWHFDNREPGKRKEAIDYWSELLLSGADALVQAKYVDELTVKEAEKELKAVARDPNAVFFYSFIQATATT
jgi:ubiquinone/menaquinone biosynthesis C-methylase UbiE